jgi:integrase
MHSTISNSLIAKLTPEPKPYEVRDVKLKGLLLRVQPSGVMTYYVEYARGKRMALGRADAVTPAQARESAKAILAQVYAGHDPAEKKKADKQHTLRSFIEEEYAPWAETNVRSFKNTMLRLNVDFADFMARKLGDITIADVEKWRTAKQKAGLKASTINRSSDDLKSLLGKAEAWLKGFDNPLTKLKRLKLDGSKKTRFLSPDEEARLRAALDAREEEARKGRDTANEWRSVRVYPLLPDLRAVAFTDHLKPMVLLSIGTGMRQGEVFGLTWDEVDLKGRVVTVAGEKAKSGQSRYIPMHDEVHAVLTDWRKQTVGDGLVFPSDSGERFNNVRKAWETVLAAADIADFRWHDMRHTFASKLALRGVDLNTIRELLGHADLTMTLRYSHLTPEHKMNAVALLNKLP